eukprot:Opistho-2@54688
MGLVGAQVQLTTTRMNAGPLQPLALCEQLAERIREQIFRREMAPGDSVDEAALVAYYGVSRTPVREALRILQREGLLTAQMRRGMFVSVLSPEEHEEAQELRRLIRRFIRIRDEQFEPTNSSLAHNLLTLIELRLRLVHPESEAC